MFERFITIAKARHALRDGRFEEAARLARDPAIADDRGAQEILRRAAARLLERARRRFDAGDLSCARADLQTLLRQAPGEDAQRLASKVDAALAEREAAAEAARKTAASARNLAERGRIAAARRRLDRLRDDCHERGEVDRFLARRRRRAAELLERVREELAAGDIERAAASYEEAMSLDEELALGDPRARDLANGIGDRLAEDLRRFLRERDAEGALRHFDRTVRKWPSAVDRARAEIDGLADMLLRDLAERGPGEAREAMARTLTSLASPLPGPKGSRLREGADALCLAQEAARGGRVDEAARALASAAGAVGGDALGKEAREMWRLASDAAARIEKARALGAAGDLDGAREEITCVLEVFPLHADARKELQMLDASQREREERYARAEQASSEGRLAEAASIAMSLSGQKGIGARANLLLKDVRARQDLVSKGLGEVLALLHGRKACTLDGVRHCIARLEELRRVQSDHREMERVVEALRREVDALSSFEDAFAALGRGEVDGPAAAVDGLLACRPHLLSKERLDSRFEDLADALLSAGERALLGGRPGDARRCGEAAIRLAGICPAAGARASRLMAEVEIRRDRAAAFAATARRMLDERDLEGAERCLNDSLEMDSDNPEARRLRAEMLCLKRHRDGIRRVEALVAERDYLQANRRLEDLPPTPPMLRTRIFDMKKSLARAQGLDGAFVLRVDEGGECVVLRGDSISIGNVRDGGADLSILANIAGRHARILRKMSFHGGMQDSIEADGGELWVGDRRVSRHVLRPGDEVRLGSSLRIAYRVPSPRSLTAELTLLGGFQVCGTDRILLLKDRGRDGRILLSSAEDAHVRVPNAEGEVEVFASRTGQMRVRSEKGGTVDGTPFSGERPLDAGALVRAAGISFALMPFVGGR